MEFKQFSQEYLDKLDSMWMTRDAEGNRIENPEFLEAFEKRAAAAVGKRRNLAAESDALAKALLGSLESPVKTHDQEAKQRTGLG
jgi:hypothetical protein